MFSSRSRVSAIGRSEIDVQSIGVLETHLRGHQGLPGIAEEVIRSRERALSLARRPTVRLKRFSRPCSLDLRTRHCEPGITPHAFHGDWDYTVAPRH